MRLNLGCWTRDMPGFVNIDKMYDKHIHHYGDVKDLSMFTDNSIDLIYASHVLEYFDRQETVDVLKEWHRVLKQSATLRLAVPSFPKLVDVYNQTGDISKILGPLYGRMQTSDYPTFIYHKTCYDENSLTQALREAGFRKVEWWDWRTVDHGEYDDHSQAYYPHMQKDGGILVSLNLQAKK